MPILSALKNVEAIFIENKAVQLVLSAGETLWSAVAGFVTANLLQRGAQPDGLDIYESGGNYYLPDNVEGRQLRPIQPGRVYAFNDLSVIYNTPYTIDFDALNDKMIAIWVKPDRSDEYQTDTLVHFTVNNGIGRPYISLMGGRLP